MNRLPSLSVRSRWMALGALGLLAIVAVLVATGGSGRGELRTTAMVHCPAGTIFSRESETAGKAGADASKDDASKDADAGATSGPLKCISAVHPESFNDLNTANSQLGARENAPFATAAPGAYAHALAQRASIQRSVHAATDTTNTWAGAGAPPECAAQTSDGKTCPPASAENGQYNGVGPLGFRTLSGRVSSLAYDPTTPGRIFASPTVGGVWESRDAGATWHSIGDGMSTQAVGAIAYDAPLHRIIAATGDNSFGGTGIAGHGILYSSDDGATWKTAAGVPDLSLGFKVVVSPVDATGNTIYAATSRGLFRSTNGGTSYVNENLPTSPAGYSPNCQGNTTNPLCFFANEVTDVIVKPAASANAPAGAVIAAVGWRAGQKPDTDAQGNPVTTCKSGGAATTCVQAPQNGLYTSSTGAPGTFAYITPTGSSTGTGLPDTAIFGRTALAVAHGQGQSPDAVYALVQDAQKFNGCPDVVDQVPPSGACNSTITGEGFATVLNGLYASYDFGKTWTKVMDSTQLKEPGTNSSLLGQPGYGPGVQGWYNLWVEADPTQKDSSGLPTRVLFGLEEIWENNPTVPATGPGGLLTTPYGGPGGTTNPYIVIGRYWNACGALNSPVPCNNNPTYGNGEIPGSTTHPDQHSYMMIPDGKGGVTLYAGSDGGIYAQHAGAGQNFSNDNWGDGLNKTISSVQPYDAEMAKDGTIVSGLQDNGEMKTAPNGHESEIFGGDAFWSTIDPNNSKNIIEEYTYASQVNLSTDGGATWYPIAPGACGASSDALFSTPIEQDPTTPGHILVGCTQIQEATNAYADPCANPDGGNAGNCQATNPPFNTVYDLSTLPSPNNASNIPSALALRGANAYVAYCGFCDPATQGIPFANGIATNVGGSAPPKIGASDGWHQAKALCADCQTANGKLPERYINSIQEDPADPNTVYVTLGGYGRRWIPPGSFGEDVSNLGVGHVFVSHDHGDHFTNITGNLPDISANWTEFHAGQLIVATDLGVYIQTSAGSASSQPTYAVLGKGLPNVPVFTIRVNPANPDQLLISTFGRGDWTYTFRSSGGTTGGGSNGGGSKGKGGKKVGPICPRPSGKLSGTTLGPLRLGMTRSAARKKLRRFRAMRSHMDDFCLARGPGIRVLYPTPRLLKRQSRKQRGRINNRIVLAVTANRFYSVGGVKPGTRLAPALRKLHSHPRGIHAGLNFWYVVNKGKVSYVLKVRRGVVLEIGVVDRPLTRTFKAQRVFFTTFSG